MDGVEPVPRLDLHGFLKDGKETHEEDIKHHPDSIGIFRPMHCSSPWSQNVPDPNRRRIGSKHGQESQVYYCMRQMNIQREK